MSDETNDGASKPSALELVQARRNDRKDAAQAEADAALAVDLEAIDAIEAQLGDSNVAVLLLPFTPGLPAAAAVRCPRPTEIKRFRDRVKPGQKDGRNREIEPDRVAAAEELGAVCVVYPTDKDVYARLCVARPGVPAQLGLRAVELAVGAEEADAKN